MSVATICERVIQDKENAAFTLVNLYDRITLTLPPDHPPLTKEAPLPVPLTIFVAFRTRGQYRATHKVRIFATGPKGETLPVGEPEIGFGDGNGANLTARIGLGVTGQGYYHFDFFLDGAYLTRVPLQIELVTSTVTDAEGDSPLSPGQTGL